MALQRTIIVVCLAVAVAAQYYEPPKQKGYEYGEHKEYHRLTKTEGKKPDPYHQKDDGYKKQEYGKVHVNKYGFKKEYEHDNKKGSYGPSEGYGKREESHYHTANKHVEKHRYESDGYKPKNQYGPEKHSYSSKTREYGSYESKKNYGPEKHSYSLKTREYGSYEPKKHYGPQKDSYSQTRHYGGYKKTSSKSTGYGEDSKYYPDGYKPSEEKKYYGGYHKEEYYHDDKKGYNGNVHGYGPKPHKKPSTRVVHEKHYYGSYGKDTKPDTALSGYEDYLHVPVYNPQSSNVYHGNLQSRGQLRGYEAAYARQKYYNSAPY